MGLKPITLHPEGVIRYVFEVNGVTVNRISELYKQFADLSRPYSSFFGTVSHDGVIQVWGVGLFCRSVIKLNTGYSNCSWGTVRIINEKVVFLIYSRGHGLYKEILDEETEDGHFKSTQLGFPVRASAGFSHPVCGPGDVVKFLDSDDNLIELNIASATNALEIFKFPSISHVTFFRAVGLNLILVGSESGDIYLVNLATRNNPTVLDNVNLLKSDIVERAKRKCHAPADENMAIPLCCTRDASTGNFIIGTRSNILVLVRLQTSEDGGKSLIEVSKCKNIPNPGVHSIVLHPAKDKMLVHCWDAKVRLFDFPSMDFIQSFEWGFNSAITAISFFLKAESNTPFIIVASEEPQLSLRPFEVSESKKR